jgi:hypothetical protein
VIPPSVDRFKCQTCESTREQDSRRPGVPECGVLHSDTDHNSFEGGSWVEIVTRHYVSHGPMSLVESLVGDPVSGLADQPVLDRSPEAVGARLARREAVVAAKLEAGT